MTFLCFIDFPTFIFSENAPQLVSHVYRAALQEIIRDKDEKFDHERARATVKHSGQMDFETCVFTVFFENTIEINTVPCKPRMCAKVVGDGSIIISFILENDLWLKQSSVQKYVDGDYGINEFNIHVWIMPFLNYDKM